MCSQKVWRRSDGCPAVCTNACRGSERGARRVWEGRERPATGQAPSARAVGCRSVTAAFIHRLRVRYSECDPQGVVFNANYVTYFDIALTELWRAAIGPYAEMMAGGADMVVAETRVRYLAPARFDDVLDISIVPTRLGNTAMTTSMEIRLGETLVVEGEMRHVFVDTGSGLKRPIPDDVRRALGPYAGEPDGSVGRPDAARPGADAARATTTDAPPRDVASPQASAPQAVGRQIPAARP